MDHTRIKFEYFKTRTQIAKELKLTTHFVVRKLSECNLSIPARKQLDLDTQLKIYLCLATPEILEGTGYEKLLK